MFGCLIVLVGVILILVGVGNGIHIGTCNWPLLICEIHVEDSLQIASI